MQVAANPDKIIGGSRRQPLQPFLALKPISMGFDEINQTSREWHAGSMMLHMTVKELKQTENTMSQKELL